MIFSDATKTKIRAATRLRADGMPLAAIGKELGCTGSYVRRLLKLPQFGIVGQEACVETCAPVPDATPGPSNCVCRDVRRTPER